MRGLALLWLALPAAAQSLTTTFNHDNGGAVGGAVYFDLSVAHPTGITLTRLDLNLSSSPGTAGTIDVYTHAGTRVGAQTNPSSWTPVIAGVNVTAAGPGQPSAAPVVLSLPQGLHGICVRTNGLAHAYTNGGTIPSTYPNAHLTLTAGEASHVPFAAPLFAPRIVNTTLAYVIGAGATVASNTTLGQGCIRKFASAYESFAWTGTFDLAGSGLRFVPTASGYALSLGGTWLAPGSISTPVPLSLGDDDEVAVPLPATATFPWRSGPSSALQVCSNGFVAAGPGNGVPFTPTVPGLLGAAQSAFFVHHDFDPSAPGSGAIEVMQNAAVTVITWNHVRGAGGTSSTDDSTFQFQFWANGVVEIDFQQLAATGNGLLVGYSPGGASADPGASDFSALVGTRPLPTADVSPLALAATTRPLLGTNWSFLTSAIPANGTFGVAVYGLGDPGITDLTAIGMPQCGLRCSLDVLATFAIGGTTHARAMAIPSHPGLLGATVLSTSAIFQSPPENAFGAITSNAIRGTLGNL